MLRIGAASSLIKPMGAPGKLVEGERSDFGRSCLNLAIRRFA